MALDGWLILFSFALAFLGLVSGFYALWYDAHHQKRLKNCPTEYAALVLSTTGCLFYMFLIGDWSDNVKLHATIGQDRNTSWLLYHLLDKLAIWLFHVVLVTRVLKVRSTDERVGDRSSLSY